MYVQTRLYQHRGKESRYPERRDTIYVEKRVGELYYYDELPLYPGEVMLVPQDHLIRRAHDWKLCTRSPSCEVTHHFRLKDLFSLCLIAMVHDYGY